MSLRMQWPACPAVRDRFEFEYISFLAQTQKKIRQNGTVSADDVLAFLKSRHGVVVDKDLVLKAIQDLGGDPTSSENEYLEIPMLVSIILIPFLLEENGKEQNESSDDTKSSGDNEDIFEVVLAIILDDLKIPVTSRPPTLDRDLIRAVIEKCTGTNSNEVSDEMLDSMIRLAGSDVLDRHSFARALTYDAKSYNVAMVTSPQSYFNDVKTMASKSTTSSTEESKLRNCKMVNTLSFIDMSGDTFQSDKYLVLLMVFTMVTYFAYIYGNYWIDELIPCDMYYKQATGCLIGRSVLNWLWIFIQLGCTGTFTFYVCSGGNNLFERSKWMTCKQIVSMSITAGLIIPFFVEEENFFLTTTDSDNWLLVGARYASLSMAVVFLLVQISNFGAYLYPNSKYFPAARCTNKKEYETKLAARYKSKQIVKNALSIRNPEGSHDKRLDSADAIYEIQAKEDLQEPFGGLFWVWRQGKKLREEHGIWYSVRTFAGVVVQFIGTIAFVLAIVYLISRVGSSQKAGDEVYTARHLYFNASGSYLIRPSDVDPQYISANNLELGYDFDDGGKLNTETIRVRMTRSLINLFITAPYGLETVEMFIDNIGDAFYNSTGIELDRVLGYVDLYNSYYEGGFIDFVVNAGRETFLDQDIIICLIVGGAFGWFAMLWTQLAYYSSYWIGTLMLRHGGAGHFALRNPFLAILRTVPVSSASLIGGAFWGILFTGFLVSSIIGGTLFLILWDESYKYVAPIIALLVGIAVTMCLRILLVVYIDDYLYTAWYRKKPVIVTVLTVIMELWNLALSFGTIIGRSVKLISIACLHIGRIDTLFLADNVNLLFRPGPLIDTYANAFGCDMLIHEAHRHPFLERLGVFYLLKIANGDAFISRPGSCWRLIFSLALLPWLKRYRQGLENNNPEEKIGNSESTILVVEESRKGAAHEAAGKAIGEQGEAEW
eukprot:CAMPEP_0194201652 /NCGR_PEP_ID=MMETSP0156-20130528/1868_1 /TAXON_ID=33649 /ORGANISM="Thalassionema nitzschioides, Strain L26-B" /LENGTH=943 /DNA_ID=CAMNT_0038926899 /DNA_START=232 /DNA_END=3060 /DNA_ORIENTATION=+